MKSFLVVFAICLAAGAIQAQSFYAGLRTGSAYMISQDPGNFNSAKYTNYYSWEKEVFFRKQGRKKWAFELGISNWTSASNIDAYYQSDEGGSFKKGRYYQSNYALDLSLQYKIAFNCMNNSRVFRHLKSYAGLKISPTWMRTHGDYHSEDFSGGNSYTYKEREHFASLWGAVTHTMIYEVTPHLSLTSAAALGFTTSYFDHDGPAWPLEQPRARISLQIGAAYKL